MGLLDAADPPGDRRRPGGKCATGQILRRLDDDDRTLLLEWIADRSFAAKAISVKLAEVGVQVAHGSIERHRRGDCVCPLDHPDWYEHG